MIDLCQGDLDLLRHAGHAGAVDREKEIVPGQHDAGVGGDRQGVGSTGYGRGKRNSPLVGVDGVGGAAHAEQDKSLGDRRIGSRCELSTDLD